MMTSDLHHTPRWFWLPSIGLPSLLCVALVVGFSQSESSYNGTALGDGQYGVDVGLGMVGSYTHSLARLATVTKKAPTPAAEIKKAARPDIVKQKTVASSSLTQPLASANAPIAAQDKQQQPIKTAAEKSDTQNTELENNANDAPLQDNPNAVAGDKNQAGSVAMNLGTGTGNDLTAGGKRGDRESYQHTLMRKLARYKKYPARAISQRQQGVVHLAFTLDRKGNVLNYSIHKSSGFPLLDRAALQMIRDANPLPAFPDNFYPDRQQMDLILPFEYSLINQ